MQTIGHRGAAGHAPENTLASFEAAIALGVDAVEFDIQFTKDGVPVVLHDATIERMAAIPVRVKDYDHCVLRGFDLGLKHGDHFRGQRLPSVEEVARLVPAHIGLHAEIKDYDPVTDGQLRSLFADLEGAGGLERVVFSSPHEDQLTAIKRLAPSARLGLLLFRDIRVPTDAARRAAHIGCHAVHPNAELVTPALVDVCHRHGMRLNAFTVNERSTMQRLLEMGVDGCFTDFPDRLRAVAA